MPAEPLDILPSGHYLQIVDPDGNDAWLERTTLPGFLFFDGNEWFVADGATNPFQFDLDHFPTQGSEIAGVLALSPTGAMVMEIGSGDAKQILMWENSGWTVVPLANLGLPDTGFGVITRNDGDDTAVWTHGANALLGFDVDENPLLIPNGTAGQQLVIVGGVPTWQNPGAGSVTTGISSTGLEGVFAYSIGTTQVHLEAPSFTVSDGATDVTLASINVTVDITLPNGLLGLDVGGEAVSTWYYIYIISDGALTSAMISDDPTGPDFTNAPSYTHWAMAGVFRNDAAGNIIEFQQRGREFFTVPIVWGNNINSTTAFSSIAGTVNLDTILPPNVTKARGNVGGSTTETVTRSMIMASTSGGLGRQWIGSRESSGADMMNFSFDVGPFDLLIVDPNSPALYWASNGNSARRRIEITGYRL